MRPASGDMNRLCGLFFEEAVVKALETLVGVDLPDEQIQPLVTGIKAKLAASDLGGALEGLKNLF